MSKVASTAEELATIAESMTVAFSDGQAQAALLKRVEGRGMMFFPALMKEAEGWQQEKLQAMGFDPQPSLRALHQSVRNHPSVKPKIMDLCEAEEKMLMNVQLKLAKENGVEPEMMQHMQAQMQQGRAAQGAHGHSHGGGGHGHGGHGHSHGGPTNFNPKMVITQNIAMSMAMKSLPKESADFIHNMQQRVMQTQKPPSGDEQLRVMQIRQTIHTKMTACMPHVASGIETLEAEQQTKLEELAKQLVQGKPPSEEQKKFVEDVAEELTVYVSMMGQMLAAETQQQPAPAGPPGKPSQEEPPKKSASDKKND